MTPEVAIATDYIGGFIYETKAYSNSNLSALTYSNKLQFFNHEEGRTRPVTDNAPRAFVYDYFIKDHLGNVRMVLTEEEKSESYLATMETAVNNFETQLFEKVEETRVNKPGGFDQLTANEKVSKLFGDGAADNRVGPGKLLKVMAGDKFTAKVFCWYHPENTDRTTDPNMPSILSGLATALSATIGGLGKNSPAEIENSGALITPLQTLLSSRPTSGPYVPIAYLNFLLLTETQLEYFEGGAAPIPEITGNMEKQLLQIENGAEITITKNGYLYVYVSNESKGNVYFDDLLIEHIQGSLLEETHYYPFGLTMAGISSKAAEGLENKRKWNVGSELNTDFDINLYETFYRSLDPQLGRFWQIDPETESQESVSPFESMGNNPISNVDPLGDFKRKWHAWLYRVFNGGGRIGQSEFGEWYVTKNKGIQESKDGNLIAKSVYFHGKGRDKYSPLREALVRDEEIQADIELKGKNSMLQIYDTPEEASQSTLNLGAGLFLPTLILRSATSALNAGKLASTGRKIAKGIRKTISGKQARHLAGTAKGGGYLNSVEDAQKVLDAVHSGEAVYLGKTNSGHPVFRYSGVTGTNVNAGVGISGQPTNIFMIKGTSNPSVVPISPAFH